MKILVCGGRTYSDYQTVLNTLEEYVCSASLVIQGGAKGADELARRASKVLEIPCKEFKANWEKYGKSAGPIRNRQMLVEGKPDLVIAFKGGKGTNNMINLALSHGVEVREITDEN